jgi:V8-like Glu-specific endopeptidase
MAPLYPVVVAQASRVLVRAGALGAALTALALPAHAGADDVASRALEQTAAEVRAYWTPERMASARPGSDLLAGIPAPADLIGGLLGGGSPTQARAAAQRVSNPAARPFRTHGKVFFHLPSGNYVCSGTVVRARTKRLVVTAGHCVFGDSAFADSWMFVPGKNGSNEPFGRWTAARLATTSQWQATEDVRYDVGMATMRKRNGRRLQRVVGGRGIAFDRGRNVDFDAFGYPAESPFNGAQLWRCRSPAQGTDSGAPPQPTRIDCDMTGGASGGGWIIGRGRVNSVVSYGYECTIPTPPLCNNPDEGKLFGPYFGPVIERLYRSQRG